MSRPTTCYPSSAIFLAGSGACTGPGALASCQNTPWFVMMLPFIEQGPLYNAFNASLGTEGPVALGLPGLTANSTVMTTKIASFQCPSDNQTDLHHVDVWRLWACPVLTHGR